MTEGMRDRMDDADDYEIAFCLGFLTVTVGKKKPFCETKVPFFFHNELRLTIF